jgi:hypothetical protein
VITFERWDDPLPLPIDGQNPGQYIGIPTEPYGEDEPLKYYGYVASDGSAVEGLLDQLDRADYLIFSSNRVYDSATRLPARYPALTRYYYHLFEGDLALNWSPTSTRSRNCSASKYRRQFWRRKPSASTITRAS